ncbi:MAG: type II secretion system protein [Planctomycetota bacterium]
MGPAARKRVGLRSSRRGLTLLETVLGVLLLGMVAATLAGTTGALRRQSERDRQRLAAVELANRLLLQFVDDEENLPSELLPIAYDGMLFRWRSRLDPVNVRLSDASLNRRVEGDAAGFDFRNRLRVVRVSVWLDAESGGSTLDDGTSPRAELTRMIDPIAFRNADAVDRKFGDDPERMMRTLLELTTGSGGATPSSGDGG